MSERKNERGRNLSVLFHALDNSRDGNCKAPVEMWCYSAQNYVTKNPQHFVHDPKNSISLIIKKVGYLTW